MADNPRPPKKLAVLIDAENVSAGAAGPLFDAIARLGDASIRRIYGDFSQPCLKSWSEVLAAHAILPQQQFACVAGKNASDIALVIDAMDLLRDGRVEGFCLVSSDSDFTRLASRIREAGLSVYLFGEQKTPSGLRQACHQFFDIGNLAAATSQSEPKPPEAKPLTALEKIALTIRKVVEQYKGKDGWAHLGGVGSELRKLEPSFASSSYGFSKLSDLVRAADMFEVQHSVGAGYRVRIRQACASRSIPILREHPSTLPQPPAAFPLQ